MKLPEVIDKLLQESGPNKEPRVGPGLRQTLLLCREVTSDLEVLHFFLIGEASGNRQTTIFVAQDVLVQVTIGQRSNARGMLGEISTHTLKDFERIEIEGNPSVRQGLKIAINSHKAGGHPPMFHWELPDLPEQEAIEEFKRLANVLQSAMRNAAK